LANTHESYCCHDTGIPTYTHTKIHTYEDTHITKTIGTKGVEGGKKERKEQKNERRKKTDKGGKRRKSKRGQDGYLGVQERVYRGG